MIVIGAAVLIGAFVSTQLLLNSIDGDPEGERGPGDSVAFEDRAPAFVSDEFGFTAHFPSEPAVESIEQQFGDIVVPVTVFTAVTGTDQFLVAVADMPENVLDLQDVDTFLTNSLNGMAGGVGGRVVDRSFTAVSNERAITGVIHFGDSDEIHAIITLHDGKQYTITTITSDLEATVAFLQTFSLQ